MQPRTRGAVILLVIIFAVITPLVLVLRNGNINLSGSAVINTPAEVAVEQPADEPPSNPDNSQVESDSAEAQDSAAAPDEQAPTSQVVVEPTAVPATNIPPTDIPPTEVPPSEIPPTTPPTAEAEATTEPTEIPAELEAETTETATAEPEAEVTLEATLAAEITPEATSEAELTPEITVEPELTPEASPEATDEPAAFEITATCTTTGTAFVITNLSADMNEPGSYSVDGTPTGDILLAVGESLTVEAGYGTPSLSFQGIEAQPETPCNPPADLAITMECKLESGVTFVVTNSGGAMQVEELYTVEQTSGESISGSLLLGENEQIEITAGYGTPTLTTGALNAQFEPACEPPSHIEGRIWQDNNADGQYSDDEPGIAGVVVELVNADDFPFQTVTLEDGQYDFFPVGAGDYTVRLQLDSLPTELEASADPDATIDAQTSLSVLAGEVYSLNFGYQPIANGSVSGMVWLETGNFGVRDSSESGLSGVTVQLTDVNGALVAEMTVAADGVYLFETLRAGDYTVRLLAETLPQPYGISFNHDDNFDLEISISITTEQSPTDIDFGVVGTF